MTRRVQGDMGRGIMPRGVLMLIEGKDALMFVAGLGVAIHGQGPTVATVVPLHRTHPAMGIRHINRVGPFVVGATTHHRITDPRRFGTEDKEVMIGSILREIMTTGSKKAIATDSTHRRIAD